MPTPIQNATAWAKVQRAFGLLGRHKLLMDEVVVPVALILDATDQEEALPGFLAYGVANAGATAGTVGLENELGSGLDLLIDRLLVRRFTAGVSAFVIKLQGLTGYAADTAGESRVQWSDMRKGEPAPPGIAIHRTVGVVTPLPTTTPTFGDLQFAGDAPAIGAYQSFIFKTPIILPPGSNLIAGAASVTEIGAYFYGRVRASEPIIGGFISP